jgi:hypothetical protein
MWSSPILSSRPAASRLSRRSCYPRHREDDSAACQFASQLIEDVEGREVDLDVRLGVEHEPFDGHRTVVDGGQRAFAKFSALAKNSGAS